MESLASKPFSVICGDCVEVCKQFEEECINLTITSPPYDNLRKYNGFNLDIEMLCSELFRITTNGGVLVWVTSDATINGSETLSSFTQAFALRKAGFRLHDTMIFRKANPIPQIYRKRYNNEFEYMFVFSKGAVKTHNPIRVPCANAGLELKSTTYKNYSAGEQKRSKQAKPVRDTKIKGNIWTYVVGKKKEDQEAKHHPAPFPCELAADHIISWSEMNDVVFDPMCGSGTVGREAVRLGRRFIGVDISDEYCSLAYERINRQYINPSIFDSARKKTE